MRQLFIIIVSFYSGNTLFNLLESLRKEKIPGWEIRTIVVDNGGLNKNISHKLSVNIKIIKNKNNLGFAGGCNVGIGYALENKADSILLINQDTEIESDFLIPLINNTAHVIAPVIKFRRGDNWIYDFGGKVNWWWGRTTHIELTRASARSRPWRDNNPIDYVSGCCMLVKKEVFEKTGLLDERFFLYFEDIDFCLRAKKAGFKVAVEPKSFIIHELIEGKQKSIFQKYHLLRSNFIFINKYLGWRRIFGYIYLIILSIKMVI